MRYLVLLRQPVSALLWGGQLASTVGDRLYYLAALWVAYRLTGSPAAVGAVAMLSAVPLVIVGIAGIAIGDRWDRFRLLITLDLARAVLVLLLPLLDLLGVLSIWHLALVGMALSGLEALFRPTLKAALPSLVPKEQVASFVGLMDVTDRLARILGPGSAGLLLVVIPEIHLFTLDALSFAVAALSIAAVARLAPTGDATLVREGAARAIAAALDYVRREPTLRLALAVRIAANALWAVFAIGTPLMVAGRFGGDLGGYGAMVGAYGAGTLASNLIVGNIRLGDRLLHVGFLGWAAVGSGFVAVALAPSLAVAVMAAAWIGVGAALAIVPTDAYIAESVPDVLQRRVYALQFTAVEGVAVGAFLPAGLLLEHVSLELALSLSGVLLSILALAALLATRRTSDIATQL